MFSSGTYRDCLEVSLQAQSLPKMHRRGTSDGFRRGKSWRKPQEPSPAPPLGPLLESVSVDSLEKPASTLLSTAQITNPEVAASYNWLDTKTPTIIVPGTPPRWAPRPDAPQLREDDGVYYRDKNASRFPYHPMEPAVRAILELHPITTSGRVDVFACGSTLGNLLRFVRGEDRDFRMLVESVGKMVHIIRRENSPKEIIQGVRGYGHAFPEAYTSWDTATGGSASHQRILKYGFGGLNFMVRHEGDGYLPEMLSQFLGPSNPSGQKQTGGVEALIGGLADTTIRQTLPGLSSPLQITRGGFQVPQAAVFDLKTRSILGKGRDFLSDELPRMWVAQIPNFILAYHTQGTFDEIEITNATSNLQEWEKSMNGELAKLAALIHHIVEVARKKPDGKLELHRKSAGKLEIREQTPGILPVLSEETMKDWKIWIGCRDSIDDLQSPQEDENADSASDVSWGGDSVDFTACSNECGYCGSCTY